MFNKIDKRTKKFLSFFRLLASPRRKELINEGCPCRASGKISWRVLGVREENSQRDQPRGIQGKRRGCERTGTFNLENVIEYVFRDYVRTDSTGISSGIIQRSARTRRLDFSTGEEIWLGFSGQCQDTWSMWNASWWVFLFVAQLSYSDSLQMKNWICEVCTYLQFMAILTWRCIFVVWNMIW